jgi:beta-lactamase class A
MAIFGKKDEEVDVEEKRKLSYKRSRTKKKKELQKPWGKKERLFVLIVFLITVLSSSILAISARNWKLPGLPRMKLPSISLPGIGEQTIIIEGSPENQRKANEAMAGVEEKTKDLSGVYGLYVARLSNGSNYGINEDEIFQAASLIKLPVMAAMYMEAEGGNINLNAKYSLKESDKTEGSGSLSSKPVGYTVTYRDVVRLMGKQSDNTAFTIAQNILGEEKISQAIVKIGMANTSLAKNETTPYEIGLFFEELWKGNIVSKESRDDILRFLTDTIYEEHLLAGVTDDIRVAHKYGRETHVVNDAGIAFFESPIVVVIMSKGVIEKEADEVIPDLARIVFDAEAP